MDKQKEPFLKDIPFKQSIFQSDFFEKLIAKKNTIYLCIGFVVTISVFLVWTFGRMEEKSLKNLLLAQSYVDDQTTEASKENLTKLIQLAKKDTVVHQRYSGLIAQELLLQGKFQEAKPYIQRSLELLRKSHLTDYTQFSEITLLSAKGEFQEALEKTLILKKSLQKKTLGLFYLFVLFQESALEEALDMKDAALKTQDEMKELLKQQRDPAVIEHFQEKTSSLIP